MLMSTGLAAYNAGFTDSGSIDRISARGASGPTFLKSSITSANFSS